MAKNTREIIIPIDKVIGHIIGGFVLYYGWQLFIIVVSGVTRVITKTNVLLDNSTWLIPILITCVALYVGLNNKRT